MSDEGRRDLLLQQSPSAREKLRTVLVRDDRGEIAQLLLRCGDANWQRTGRRDTLTMSEKVRRKLVRRLAESDASEPGGSG